MGMKSLSYLLCTIVVVSVVSAIPYYSESRHTDVLNQHSKVSLQAGQNCHLSGACEICQTAQMVKDGTTNDVHVCLDDGKSAS